jgi:hypothetical protein
MKVVLGLLMGLMSVSASAGERQLFAGQYALASGDQSICSKHLGVIVIDRDGRQAAVASSNVMDTGPELEVSGIAGGSEQDGMTQFTSINVSGGRAELTFQFVHLLPRNYRQDVRRVTVTADAASAVYEVTSFVPTESPSFTCTYAAE